MTEVCLPGLFSIWNGLLCTKCVCYLIVLSLNCFEIGGNLDNQKSLKKTIHSLFLLLIKGRAGIWSWMVSIILPRICNGMQWDWGWRELLPFCCERLIAERLFINHICSLIQNDTVYIYLKKIIYLCIYLFLAVLGLCYCTGFALVMVHGLLLLQSTGSRESRLQ